MTYEDKIVEDTLKKVKEGMRKVINRRLRGKDYYELRVKENKFDMYCRYILLGFYQEAFKQGVYTAK